MGLDDFYESIYRKIPLSELNEEWFINELQTNQKSFDILKRLMDMILSLVILVVFSPLWILIMILNAVTSAGPVIYKQKRVGRNGQEFTVYKFRTMIIDAEKAGAVWSAKGDDRVTSFGKILRYTHLDEMPQLWNILSGDLSFVGPRPERPEFTTTLKDKIAHYNIRHIIKPGLTGWAQINYRYGATVEDALEKLQYEIYYLKHRSIILDILIMIKTIRMIFQNH